MTKKDFNKLAYGLAMCEPGDKDPCHQVWLSCVHQVITACKETNKRCDPERFLEACHYEYWKTHKKPH